MRANPRQSTGIIECILSGMIRDRTFHRSHQASRCIQHNKAEGDWMESSFSNHNVAQKVCAQLGQFTPVNHNLPTVCRRISQTFERCTRTPGFPVSALGKVFPRRPNSIGPGFPSIVHAPLAMNNGAGETRSYYARVYAI